jgi:ribosome assembly protein 1
MDPEEAYIYLVNLLEKTNSLMGSLIVRDINLESESKNKYKNSHKTSSDLIRNNSEDNNNNNEVDMNILIQEKEDELYFSPEKGNVIFASAIDCWGFTLESFSDLLSKSTGFKREVITKLLWGEYYFNKSTKKVHKTKINNNSKPMFVEFVLNNIYKLYNLALIDKNLDAVLKASKTVGAELLKNEVNMFDKNPRMVLRVNKLIN